MSTHTIETRLVGDDGARLAALEQSLPNAARSMLEIVYVLAVLLAPELAGSHSARVLWSTAAALGMLGILVLRPWARSGPSRAVRAAMCIAAVALVALSFANRPRDLMEDRPRIGVELENVPHEAGDPGSTRSTARITRVRPGSPAAGHLRVGDRIAAIDGKALDGADPAGDVVRRAHEPRALGPNAVFSVLRDRGSLDVRLTLDAARPAASGRGFFLRLSARDLCLLLLAVLIVISDGQGLRQIGLMRDGSLRESVHGVRVLIATYVVHLCAALPLAAVAKILGSLQSDATQRSAFVGALVGNAVEVHPWEIPLYLGFAGAFEEVVFRGLLITRLRRVFGRWSVSLGVAAALFGLGHLAEGVLGALQTTALGLWFGWVFLRRRRLESVIVAHAAFNTIMFALMIYFVNSGLWERAQRLIGH